MPKQTQFKDISHTVYLSSNIGKNCEHCDYWIGPPKNNDFSSGINHYLSKHDYKLLHVGQEASEDRDGRTIHFTVAIVGR